MTTLNKTIKPFCVLMSDATEDEIRSLHQMMLDAGVEYNESVERFVASQEQYPFMGCTCEGTYCYDIVDKDFEYILITLDQVPSYLGLDTKDKTLVAGTIEHAYVTLKGDLDNCEEGFDDENSKFLNYNSKEGKYFSFFSESCLCDHVDVCTVKEFQEYASNRKKLGEISGVKSLNDESPYEGAKPLKWTLTAYQEGVVVQSGMLVKVVTVCPEYQGEGVVLYLGKEQAMVDIDGVEEMVHIDCIKPFDDSKTLEDVQREMVVSYFDSCDIKLDTAISMYKDLLGMSVFKEK